MPLAPDAPMAVTIHRRRPIRSATSLPTIDAGTAIRFTTAAIAAAGQGNVDVACRLAEYPRNATIQAREPKSSRQWAK